MRRGRGNATGTGNYSGRWLKGQKSRSWHSMKPFFEWGQTSIVQRLPKTRGFTRYYKLVKHITIINLSTLDADTRISDTMEITKQLLKDLWYIKSTTAIVKILWHGDYAKHLTFKDIDSFSASAKEKIEKPGTVHAVSKKASTKIANPVKKMSTTEKKPIKKSAPVKSIKEKTKDPKKAVIEKKSITKKPVAKKTK